MEPMMKQNDKIKEAAWDFARAVLCLTLFAGIGVMLAWRG
jgi:hypothetical protein